MDVALVLDLLETGHPMKRPAKSLLKPTLSEVYINGLIADKVSAVALTQVLATGIGLFESPLLHSVVRL